MAGMNAYTSSLRSDKSVAKPYEPGVPFFVPQLSKVKTSIMCQQKLLFNYESPGMSFGPLSPTSLPYRKQGNHSLYTEENLKKRRALMEDPAVQKAIERYWETFPCIRRGGDTLTMHDYIDVFTKFYKALVAPSEFSIGEARCIVEKDWARDSIDGENMSKLLFFGALFEVVDIWTVDISAEEYAVFLQKLFDRVTMTIYDHVKLQWITAYAELDRIQSFYDPTPPDQDTNQDNDESKQPIVLEPISNRPLSSSQSSRSPNSLSDKSKQVIDRRLPDIRVSRSGINDNDGSYDSWGGDFGSNAAGRVGRENLFQASPTKTKLEQVLDARRNERGDDGQKKSPKSRPPRPGLPDLPSQQVLLSIPSIYLNPDLTHVHDASRAARRRLRKNVKLVQRLRRITY